MCCVFLFYLFSPAGSGGEAEAQRAAEDFKAAGRCFKHRLPHSFIQATHHQSVSYNKHQHFHTFHTTFKSLQPNESWPQLPNYCACSLSVRAYVHYSFPPNVAS